MTVAILQNTNDPQFSVEINEEQEAMIEAVADHISHGRKVTVYLDSTIHGKIASFHIETGMRNPAPSYRFDVEDMKFFGELDIRWVDGTINILSVGF